MTIQEVMLRIEIPEEVRENIGKYSLSEKEFYEWKHLFENDFEIFLNKWREPQKHFQWVLWFYLKLVCEVHEKYKEKDISEEIFHDTFCTDFVGSILCNFWRSKINAIDCL